jgi:hypothetical protein
MERLNLVIRERMEAKLVLITSACVLIAPLGNTVPRREEQALRVIVQKDTTAKAVPFLQNQCPLPSTLKMDFALKGIFVWRVPQHLNNVLQGHSATARVQNQ